MEQKTCKDRLSSHYRGRMKDLRLMWKNEKNGTESADIGPLNEYGLSFDYVAPFTWPKQRMGYFRYQISWGGPSDEFRFYIDEQHKPYRIEYWFMDWFDGAHKTFRIGKTFDFLCQLFDWMTGDYAKNMIEDAMKE